MTQALYLRFHFFIFEFPPDVLSLFSSCSCCDRLARLCRRKKELKARTVWLGRPEKCEEKFPKNAIKNQKYNILTFVPGVSETCKLLYL